jgi:hypothetical protein
MLSNCPADVRYARTLAMAVHRRIRKAARNDLAHDRGHVREFAHVYKDAVKVEGSWRSGRGWDRRAQKEAAKRRRQGAGTTREIVCAS